MRRADTGAATTRSSRRPPRRATCDARATGSAFHRSVCGSHAAPEHRSRSPRTGRRNVATGGATARRCQADAQPVDSALSSKPPRPGEEETLRCVTSNADDACGCAAGANMGPSNTRAPGMRNVPVHFGEPFVRADFSATARRGTASPPVFYGCPTNDSYAHSRTRTRN